MTTARTIWAVLLCLSPVFAYPDAWRFSNPRPHGNHIYDLGIHDAAVWQVGDRGRIYTSTDLDVWIPHETGTFRSLRGITFQDSVAFISGEEGTILSGTNPSLLSLQSLGTTNWLEGIAASANAIVAVGDNGAIYSSGNGATWTRRGNFTEWLRGVAYGGGQFVAVGENGFIASSTDGESWTARSSPVTGHFNKVAWVNDRFWVVGEAGAVLTNTFRMAFQPVNVGVTNTLFAVAGNSSEVVLAGDSVVLLGNLQTETWTSQSDASSPALAPLWPYYSALWDGRLFLLGGRAGMLVEGFRTNQNSALAWYSEVQPTRSWLWSVTHAADLYVAAGVNGTIVTSADGVEWDLESVPGDAADELLLGVGGNTNVLLAVGSEGTILRSENIYTNVVTTNIAGQVVTNRVSLLGLAWTRAPIQFTNDLQGVAVNDSTYVVTGAGGRILTSSDGLAWQSRPSGVSSFLSGVTAWPGGFVTVGAGGVILTSENGTTWTPRDSGVQDWVYAVRYGGDRLVAVGESGLILTSTDGSNWTQRASGTTEWLNDVVFARGKWFVTGGTGTIVTSSDSVNWTASPAITSRSLYGIASDGNQLVAVGLEGVILRNNLQTVSSPVSIVSYDNVNAASLFLFRGAPDQQFILEHATSLPGPWSSIATLELSASGTLVYELSNRAATRGFFRTRLR